MAKYIKELKYTDVDTSTDYYVDTRAIKDANDTTKNLNEVLASKGEKLPNASAAGKILKSTNATGGVEWGDMPASAVWGNITGTLSNQTDLQSALDGKLSTSLKGAASGLAELDSAGKVPAAQLPAFVDDVLEYPSLADFPAIGESGKIYIAKDTNKCYRWSGTQYTEISASLALGETESTAYRGDRGATAYAHSQLTTGNPHNVTASQVLGNASAAGKVLKSTDAAGGVEWGDAGKVDAITTGGKDLDPVDKKIEIDKVLTKAEYDALSSAEKNNGMNYYVTDEDTMISTVVQTTGTSTFDVMSQNAVTEALSTKANSSDVTTALSTKVDIAQGSSNKGKAMMCDAMGYIYPVGTDIVALHNTIWRGENLIALFGSISAIEAAVAAGDFSNIYLGDYIPITAFDAGYGLSDDRVIVMEIQGYRNIGDSTVGNHLIMSLTCGSRKMNDTNITTGGYKGTKIHTEAMPAIQTSLENIFGSSHVLTTKVLMTNTVNDSTPSMAGAGLNGASTSWEWVATKCWLPNEVNVYGSAIFSSSAYDNGGFPHQIAAYRVKEHVQIWDRSGFWLSCVAYAGVFCLAYDTGLAGFNGASAYSLPLRPLFLLG